MRFLGSMPTPGQVNAALLLIRIVLGAIFIAHGMQKVFVYGMGGVGSAFAELGIPAATLLGPAVSVVELVGGGAILAGAFTRLAGAGIAATMLGAMYFAHLPAGFFAPDGIEFTLMLFAGASALVVMGAGTWSVDAVLERTWHARAAGEGEAHAGRAGAV